MANRKARQTTVIDNINSPVFSDPHHILLTEKQAAEYLQVSVKSLQQRRYKSLQPDYIKFPGSSAVRYRLAVLMAFAAAGEVQFE